MAKRYLLLMLDKQMPNPAPEQAQAGMKAWQDWMAANRERIREGLPVYRVGKAVRKRSIKDYSAKTTDVSGYLIINAESMEEAVKIAQSSPHARMNAGTTIVRECIDVPM